jgi:uncharacterized protein
MEIKPDHKALIELAHAKMYYGKYKDYYLSDIPEYYLIWHRQKGFPKGKLGDQLMQVTDLKVNGMEHILRTIRNKYPKYQ